MAVPHRLGRLHELLIAHRQHRRAYHAGIAGHEGEPHRDHDVDDARPEAGDHGDRQQHRGDAHEDVHHPHDDVVQPPAEITRHGADHDAGRHGAGHRRQPDGERNAGAVDHPRQDVPPVVVGAHQVLRAGGLALVDDVLLDDLVVVVHQHVREDGDEHEHHEDHQPDHRLLVAEKPAAEFLKRALLFLFPLGAGGKRLLCFHGHTPHSLSRGSIRA